MYRVECVCVCVCVFYRWNFLSRDLWEYRGDVLRLMVKV